ncbi:DUF5790 family protein [Halalkalicoccus salilacus]|uniref:DUF5790 family protein n=1 Tax=Halalkalicoccus TaxID=332246 RepID=UPI002F96DFA8
MSQSTLDDDDLFGEAASEIREDVEAHLDAARAELPGPDEIWETDAENVLGVLNGLKSTLDTGDATDHLRDAKKWFMVGERADAFEDPESLQEEFDELEELIEEIEDARDSVGDLASTVPELRGSLEEFDADGVGDEGDEEDESDADDAEESEEDEEDEESEENEE